MKHGYISVEDPRIKEKFGFGFWIFDSWGVVPQGSTVTVVQRSEARFVPGPRGQPFWISFFDIGINFLTLLRGKELSVGKASRCFKSGDVWHFC